MTDVKSRGNYWIIDHGEASSNAAGPLSAQGVPSAAWFRYLAAR